jgi:hypothetical protein
MWRGCWRAAQRKGNNRGRICRRRTPTHRDAGVQAGDRQGAAALPGTQVSTPRDRPAARKCRGRGTMAGHLAASRPMSVDDRELVAAQRRLRRAGPADRLAAQRGLCQAIARRYGFTIAETTARPASFSSRTKTATVPPIRDDVSFAVALHELGHGLAGACPNRAPHHRDPRVTAAVVLRAMRGARMGGGAAAGQVQLRDVRALAAVVCRRTSARRPPFRSRAGPRLPRPTSPGRSRSRSSGASRMNCDSSASRKVCDPRPFASTKRSPGNARFARARSRGNAPNVGNRGSTL